MVQVLPYVQSPLEQLNPYIQQAAQVGGGLARSYLSQRGDATVLQQIQEKAASGTGNPLEYATLWGRLSEGARKKYEPLLQSQLKMQEAQTQSQLRERESEAKQRSK